MDNIENMPVDNDKGGMGGMITLVIVIVLIIVGGFYYMNSKKPAELNPTSTPTPTPVANTSTEADKVAVKKFTVEGSNYKFMPNILSVKKGDNVTIVFKNVGGTHNFRIDEFDVATKQIKGGAEETVQFVADEVGSFEYYCSVGTHRAMGMKGMLTVSE